jgi:hypothetical protein
MDRSVFCSGEHDLSPLRDLKVGRIGTVAFQIGELTVPMSLLAAETPADIKGK